MKRRFVLMSCALVMTLMACQNSDTKYLSAKDSTDILKTVLDNKDFKKELETKDDTVYYSTVITSFLPLVWLLSIS